LKLGIELEMENNCYRITQIFCISKYICHYL